MIIYFANCSKLAQFTVSIRTGAIQEYLVSCMVVVAVFFCFFFFCVTCSDCKVAKREKSPPHVKVPPFPLHKTSSNRTWNAKRYITMSLDNICTYVTSRPRARPLQLTHKGTPSGQSQPGPALRQLTVHTFLPMLMVHVRLNAVRHYMPVSLFLGYAHVVC